MHRILKSWFLTRSYGQRLPVAQNFCFIYVVMLEEDKRNFGWKNKNEKKHFGFENLKN